MKSSKGDDELKVLEPALTMKKELIHTIREYLRMKHKVPYTYDDVIGDIDNDTNPDGKLQIMLDLTSDFKFPDNIINDLDTKKSQKEISAIQTQLKLFSKKKKDLDEDDPILKNKLGGEPSDEEGVNLPDDDKFDIPKFDEIKANIIAIISLIGKIELKDNKPELGDTYLIDVISPIINQIDEIKSRTTLIGYLATL